MPSRRIRRGRPGGIPPGQKVSRRFSQRWTVGCGIATSRATIGLVEELSETQARGPHQAAEVGQRGVGRQRLEAPLEVRPGVALEPELPVRLCRVRLPGRRSRTRGGSASRAAAWRGGGRDARGMASSGRLPGDRRAGGGDWIAPRPETARA